MKSRRIVDHCRKKFDEFVASITNDAIQDTVTSSGIITGGAIASLLLGEDVHDYDIYFNSREATLQIAEYFINWFGKRNNSLGMIAIDRDKLDRVAIVIPSKGFIKEINQKEKPKYRPICLTSNAITLANKVQLITRFYGTPSEIHANYDFVHCTNYWTSWNNELVLNQPALESLLARDLRYVGSKYPICSIIRTRKFIKRGWKCSAGEYLKMCLEVSDLNLTDMAVLEKQLIGVDAAYFQQIIAALKERNVSRVDRTYLYELIDRIF